MVLKNSKNAEIFSKNLNIQLTASRTSEVFIKSYSFQNIIRIDENKYSYNEIILFTINYTCFLKNIIRLYMVKKKKISFFSFLIAPFNFELYQFILLCIWDENFIS